MLIKWVRWRRYGCALQQEGFRFQHHLVTEMEWGYITWFPTSHKRRRPIWINWMASKGYPPWLFFAFFFHAVRFPSWFVPYLLRYGGVYPQGFNVQYFDCISLFYVRTRSTWFQPYHVSSNTDLPRNATKDFFSKVYSVSSFAALGLHCYISLNAHSIRYSPLCVISRVSL